MCVRQSCLSGGMCEEECENVHLPVCIRMCVRGIIWHVQMYVGGGISVHKCKLHVCTRECRGVLECGRKT